MLSPPSLMIHGSQHLSSTCVPRWVPKLQPSLRRRVEGGEHVLSIQEHFPEVAHDSSCPSCPEFSHLDICMLKGDWERNLYFGKSCAH